MLASNNNAEQTSIPEDTTTFGFPMSADDEAAAQAIASALSGTFTCYLPLISVSNRASVDRLREYNEEERTYDQGQSHETHISQSDLAAEDQEQLHVGNSSMPRTSSLHGHGSLRQQRHQQHALDPYSPVGTKLINTNRPPLEMPWVTAERSSQATIAQSLISRKHAHSPTQVPRVSETHFRISRMSYKFAEATTTTLT